MHLRTDLHLLLSLAMVALIFCSGCTGSTGTLPVTATGSAQPPAEVPQGTPSAGPDDLSRVTGIQVTTAMAAWTDGPVSDGISVHPALIDAAGQKIPWSGVTIPVDIEIYTIKLDMKAKPIRGQRLYGGYGTISNWTDGDPFKGGGIRIPFSHLNVPGGEKYGWTYATVHLPDGRTFTGQFNATWLRAPVPR